MVCYVSNLVHNVKMLFKTDFGEDTIMAGRKQVSPHAYVGQEASVDETGPTDQGVSCLGAREGASGEGPARHDVTQASISAGFCLYETCLPLQHCGGFLQG